MGLVMKLDDSTFNAKAKALGVGSALMIVSGYYGELVVTGDLTPRWACWFLSMFFFLYIVYELLVGLSAATEQEPMYLWFRSTAVADKYKSAVLISGLVTFIAAYHYFRIFNSWVEAFSYSAGQIVNGALEINAPTLTGVPF